MKQERKKKRHHARYKNFYKQNLETVQKELQIKKNEEFSRYQQEEKLLQKANERTETIKKKAEKEQEAEKSEIKPKKL